MELNDSAISDLDFLLLPELFNCRFTADEFTILKNTRDVISDLRRISRENPELILVAGSFPIVNSRTGEMRNVSLTLRDGEVVHRAAKTHLFKPFREPDLFVRGENPGPFAATVRSQSVRCGVIICYDLRFPELPRRIAMEGLDILFVPAIWSRERDTAWRTLLAARAVENQIFTIGANSDGKSYCFSPSGECRFESEDIVEFASFKINLNEISETKRFINTIEDAYPD
jgi:omega-amidase